MRYTSIGPAFKLEWKLSTTSGPLNYEAPFSYLWSDIKHSNCNFGGGFTQYVSGGIGVGYFFFDDAMLIHTNVRDGMCEVFPGG